MFFYITLFLFLLLMLLFSEKVLAKDKWKIEIFTIFVLIVVSGTRLNIGGTDYFVYKSVFYSLPKITLFLKDFTEINSKYLTYNFEIGYLFLNSIVKTMNINFYGYTLIHSIIFYLSLYFGLRKYITNYNFFLIVFIYKLFFYNTFISMRQSITLAIFILSLTFLEKRRFIPYFTICIFASIFHTAALVLIPIYFITYLRVDRNIFILLVLIFLPSLVISTFNFPILKIFEFVKYFIVNPEVIVKMNKFLFSTPEYSLSIIHSIEYLLISLYIVLNFNNISKNPNSDIFIKLFLFLLPIFTLFRNYEILTRFKDYFVISYGVLLSYSYSFTKQEKAKLIRIFAIVICAIGFFRFIILFDNGNLVPYNSYLIYLSKN